MTIKYVGIQMDPVRTINKATDSTYALMLEAQARGYELFHYTPKDMSMIDGIPYAEVSQIKSVNTNGLPVTFGSQPYNVRLQDLDVILLRQDPPFDMNYITTTHLLETVADKTLVVNDPFWVRNCPEKIFVTKFPDLMPPTTIAFNPSQVYKARNVYSDIIVKPLFGNGGAGVFHVKPDDENITSLLEMFWQNSREPLMVQKYLPEVRQGDKRIILVDGNPVGAISRVPAQGEARANLHVGGTAHKTTLTEREKHICERIGPELRRMGLTFVGIDVIGDYMTEINVTSPTGIHQINAFDGINIQAIIWDAIERRFNERN